MGSFSKGRRHHGSLLIGLILVALGVLLLLTATGAISFGIWFELVDFWPVLLALIGVEIILAQRGLLIRTGVAALTLTVAVAAAFLSMPEYDSAEPLRVSYVEPLGTTRALHLSMGFLGGSVELTSAPHGSSSVARLLAADFESHPARVIRERLDGDMKLYLASSGPFLKHSSIDGYTKRESRVSFPVGLADWRLVASPDVELEIEVASGSTDLDLDLRGLKVRKIVVEAGTLDIRVQLPASAGLTDVEIAAGATNVEISVPDNVAARIDIDSPFGSAWIDPSRFIDSDDVYQSPHYFEARNRVSIRIDALVVANVTVS